MMKQQPIYLLRYFNYDTRGIFRDEFQPPLYYHTLEKAKNNIQKWNLAFYKKCSDIGTFEFRSLKEKLHPVEDDRMEYICIDPYTHTIIGTAQIETCYPDVSTI